MRLETADIPNARQHIPGILAPKLRMGAEVRKLCYPCVEGSPRSRGDRLTRSRASHTAFPSGAWERGEDIPGFCKAATLEEIRGHDHVLTPGRYVGAAAVEDDGVPFPERFAELKARLDEQLAEGDELGALIRAKLEGVLADG